MPDSPTRQQRDYLRQVLSQDKKPLALFLGAGCPVAIRVGKEKRPLIPDIAGMSEIIRAKLKEEAVTKDAIITLEENFADDHRELNIETLLTHVRTLREVVGKGEIRGLTAEDLKNLETKATSLIVSLAGNALPGAGTPYHWVAAWVGAAVRLYPVELFTSNYDLLLEQALEETRVPYFDGFLGAHKPFFDTYAIEQDTLPPRWARVWKVHGSISWFEENGVVFRRTGTHEDPAALRVIHPSHLKYDESRRMPYVVMLDRLRGFVQKVAASLITCGYSYRDDHINAVILDGLRANPMTSVFGLLHGALDKYPLAKEIEALPPNLSLLARDAACIGSRRIAYSKENDGETFTLGDFAEFGAFLKEVIGASREAGSEGSP